MKGTYSSVPKGHYGVSQPIELTEERIERVGERVQRKEYIGSKRPANQKKRRHPEGSSRGTGGLPHSEMK